jgi:CRP/FNR family transcriptional regulator, cyclic AMP receptor protein
MSAFVQSVQNPLHGSILAGLPDRQLAPFLERSVQRRYAAGQIIQLRGEPAQGCWLIESGRVRLGQFSESGKFVALSLIGPGESWGELAVLRRAPRVIDAIAADPTLLRWVDAAQFEAVLARHPEAMRSLLGLLGDQLQVSLESLISARGDPAGPRIAQLLSTLTQSDPQLRMTHQDLAELGGLSRMTIHTWLKRWEQAGWITIGYGRIKILNSAALRNWANSNSSARPPA